MGAPLGSTQGGQAKEKPKWEVADVFLLSGEEYRNNHYLPWSLLKIMQDIEQCRTHFLGGHVSECDNNCCGHEEISYNSCRNRHCPKCQTMNKAKWLEARKAELLPTGYFHNVFTLPHELNPLILRNKKTLLDLLFQATKETLLTFCNDPKHRLVGKPGFTSVLHTWDQKLNPHFHLHCVIAGGVFSEEENKWVEAKNNYLFPVEALSIVFRRKYLDSLKKLYYKGKLQIPNTEKVLSSQEGFQQLISRLYQKNWVVYSKESFQGAEKVFDYLGRYTHRVAISNHRILHVDKDKVVFQYRDRKDGYKLKELTLSHEAFISRFLFHALPSGFMRIRNYGFLANSAKKKYLPLIRSCLNVEAPISMEPKTVSELMLTLTGKDITLCPKCKKGHMKKRGEIPPFNTKLKTRDPPPS